MNWLGGQGPRKNVIRKSLWKTFGKKCVARYLPVAEGCGESCVLCKRSSNDFSWGEVNNQVIIRMTHSVESASFPQPFLSLSNGHMNKVSMVTECVWSWPPGLPRITWLHLWPDLSLAETKTEPQIGHHSLGCPTRTLVAGLLHLNTSVGKTIFCLYLFWLQMASSHDSSAKSTI